MAFPFPETYQLITLTSDIIVTWPASFSSNQVIANWNNVTANADDYSITLPDAKLATTGQGITFNNISIHPFKVLANDGTTLLATITSGQIKYFNLNDTSTSNGGWDIIAFGGGTTSITNLTAESTDNTITITNGNIIPPGGTINFQLTSSIANLNSINVSGFPAITKTAPLRWASRNVVAGDNILITNGDGIAGNPLITLSPTLENISSIDVSGLSITNSEISPTGINSGMNINSKGTGILNLNSVHIDTSGNVSNVNDLIIGGTFYNSYTPKAWCFFTDTLIGISTHDIIVRNGANIFSVTGGGGQYELTFNTSLDTHLYGVLITVGTEIIGGSPIVAHGFTVFNAQTTSKCRIVVVDASGEYVRQAPNGITVQILSML